MKEVESNLIPNWVKVIVDHFRLIFDSCKKKVVYKNKEDLVKLYTINDLEKPVQPLDHSY